MIRRRALVVGAGPAGVAAATHLAAAGLAVQVVDAQHAIGGALLHYGAHRMDFLFRCAVQADDVQAMLVRHVKAARRAHGLRLSLGWRVKSLHPLADGVMADGVRYDLAILAVGARPRSRRLHDPGRGVIVGPGRLLESKPVCGKQVAVLGGGDNAMENAARMAEAGAQVTLFSRGSPRALQPGAKPSSRALLDRAAHAGVRMVFDAQPTLDGLCIHWNGRALRFDLVCVFHGFEPRDELWRDLLAVPMDHALLGIGDRILITGDAARMDDDRSLDKAWRDGELAAKWALAVLQREMHNIHIQQMEVPA